MNTPAMATPVRMKAMTNNLPLSVFGDMSPYPTVVVEIATKYAASTLVLKSPSPKLRKHSTETPTYATKTIHR